MLICTPFTVKYTVICANVTQKYCITLISRESNFREFCE